MERWKCVQAVTIVINAETKADAIQVVNTIMMKLHNHIWNFNVTRFHERETRALQARSRVFRSSDTFGEIMGPPYELEIIERKESR